jgi:hypothetical protein
MNFKVKTKNGTEKIINNDNTCVDQESFMREMLYTGCLADGDHGKKRCPLCIVEIKEA